MAMKVNRVLFPPVFILLLYAISQKKKKSCFNLPYHCLCQTVDCAKRINFLFMG